MLQFVREIPIRIVIQGALSSRRGFLFHLSAGFSHEVDPLSGMSVNLMLVDEWLWKLKKSFEIDAFTSTTESFNHSFSELMALARLTLTEEAAVYGVSLTHLQFREERGWAFSWEASLPPDEMIFRTSLYVESFQAKGTFELLRIHLNWLRQQGCEADYQHETFLLLKSMSHQEAALLPRELQKWMGYKLPSGSFLKSIQLEHLGENFSVTL